MHSIQSYHIIILCNRGFWSGGRVTQRKRSIRHDALQVGHNALGEQALSIDLIAAKKCNL
jgi:hypothetical protein